MAATQSKERILAGAKELFLARGYAAATADAICEKAELTKRSPRVDSQKQSRETPVIV